MKHKLLVAVDGEKTSWKTAIYVGRSFAGCKDPGLKVALFHVLPKVPISYGIGDLVTNIEQLAAQFKTETEEAARHMLAEMKTRVVCEGVRPESVITFESDCLDELAGLLDATMKRMADRMPHELQRVQRIIEADTNPAHAIIQQATRNHTELIVMATHGRGWVRGELLGSTAQNVIRRSLCPVVALRMPEMGLAERRPLHLHIRRILLPTDLSRSSLKAFSVASALAKPFGATLTALFVTEQTDVDLARRTLEQFVKSHCGERVPITCAASTGEPAHQIVEYAIQHNVDLIAMATQGHDELHDRLFGSTTERVLRRSPWPVLVVK